MLRALPSPQHRKRPSEGTKGANSESTGLVSGNHGIFPGTRALATFRYDFGDHTSFQRFPNQQFAIPDLYAAFASDGHAARLGNVYACARLPTIVGQWRL
jgi:hypothetical protein